MLITLALRSSEDAVHWPRLRRTASFLPRLHLCWIVSAKFLLQYFLFMAAKTSALQLWNLKLSLSTSAVTISFALFTIQVAILDDVISGRPSWLSGHVTGNRFYKMADRKWRHRRWRTGSDVIPATSAGQCTTLCNITLSQISRHRKKTEWIWYPYLTQLNTMQLG